MQGQLNYRENYFCFLHCGIWLLLEITLSDIISESYIKMTPKFMSHEGVQH